MDYTEHPDYNQHLERIKFPATDDWWFSDWVHSDHGYQLAIRFSFVFGKGKAGQKAEDLLEAGRRSDYAACVFRALYKPQIGSEVRWHGGEGEETEVQAGILKSIGRKVAKCELDGELWEVPFDNFCEPDKYITARDRELRELAEIERGTAIWKSEDAKGNCDDPEIATIAADVNTINSIWNRIKQNSAKVIEDSIYLGHALEIVKKHLPHGEFTPWVESNCDFTIRNAQYLMKAASKCPLVDGCVSIPDHVEKLSDLTKAPKKKSETKDETKNETVSHLDDEPEQHPAVEAIVSSVEAIKSALRTLPPSQLDDLLRSMGYIRAEEEPQPEPVVASSFGTLPPLSDDDYEDVE